MIEKGSPSSCIDKDGRFASMIVFSDGTQVGALIDIQKRVTWPLLAWSALGQTGPVFFIFSYAIVFHVLLLLASHSSFAVKWDKSNIFFSPFVCLLIKSLLGSFLTRMQQGDAEGRVWGSKTFCICEISRYLGCLEISSKCWLLLQLQSNNLMSKNLIGWKNLLFNRSRGIRLALPFQWREVKEGIMDFSSQLRVPLAELCKGAIKGRMKKGA